MRAGETAILINPSGKDSDNYFAFNLEVKFLSKFFPKSKTSILNGEGRGYQFDFGRNSLNQKIMSSGIASLPATRKNIDSALRAALNDTSDEGALILFTGHCDRSNIPVSVTPTNTMRNEDSSPERGIDYDDLWQKLRERRNPQKQIRLILTGCFSGAFGEAMPFPDLLPNVCFVTSSESGQFSYGSSSPVAFLGRKANLSNIFESENFGDSPRNVPFKSSDFYMMQVLKGVEFERFRKKTFNRCEKKQSDKAKNVPSLILLESAIKAIREIQISLDEENTTEEFCQLDAYLDMFPGKKQQLNLALLKENSSYSRYREQFINSQLQRYDFLKLTQQPGLQKDLVKREIKDGTSAESFGFITKSDDSSAIRQMYLTQIKETMFDQTESFLKSKLKCQMRLNSRVGVQLLSSLKEGAKDTQSRAFLSRYFSYPYQNSPVSPSDYFEMDLLIDSLDIGKSYRTADIELIEQNALLSKALNETRANFQSFLATAEGAKYRKSFEMLTKCENSPIGGSN